MTTKDEVREGTEPRECNCGYAQGIAHYHAPDCAIYPRTPEPREDGLFTKGIETCGEALEIVKNVRKKIEAALPKKEGVAVVSAEVARKQAEYLAENMGDYNVNGEVVENGLVGEFEKEGEGWDWEAEFDNQFGKDGPEGNSDSIGRKAGCDDCVGNIEIRREHKAFIRQHFISRTAVEKMIEEAMKENYDGIEFAQSPIREEIIANRNYNQALRDLLEKIKKE